MPPLETSIYKLIHLQFHIFVGRPPRVMCHQLIAAVRIETLRLDTESVITKSSLNRPHPVMPLDGLSATSRLRDHTRGGASCLDLNQHDTGNRLFAGGKGKPTSRPAMRRMGFLEKTADRFRHFQHVVPHSNLRSLPVPAAPRACLACRAERAHGASRYRLASPLHDTAS